MLSAQELDQLGSGRLPNSSPSSPRFPTREEWPVVRQFLLENSLSGNPALHPQLTAYTPGEALVLLQALPIRDWHYKICSVKLQPFFKAAVFVPGQYDSRMGTHNLKDALQVKYPHISFVVISHPLALVGAGEKEIAPQCTSPGLAPGASPPAAEWEKSPLGQRFLIPFGAAAYETATALLGGVISAFMMQHRHVHFYSAEGLFSPLQRPYCDMLRNAQKYSGMAIPPFPQ